MLFAIAKSYLTSSLFTITYYLAKNLPELRPRRFLGCVSDLDANPCESDLDAHGFCKGYNNPLVMMGVALDRCLPGRNAMLENETM